jgi:hypothetical protein
LARPRIRPASIRRARLCAPATADAEILGLGKASAGLDLTDQDARSIRRCTALVSIDVCDLARLEALRGDDGHGGRAAQMLGRTAGALSGVVSTV